MTDPNMRTWVANGPNHCPTDWTESLLVRNSGDLKQYVAIVAAHLDRHYANGRDGTSVAQIARIAVEALRPELTPAPCPDCFIDPRYCT